MRLPARYRPPARAVNLLQKRYRARLRARIPVSGREQQPTAHIVGCGRSGTTVLGRMLGSHPDVAYLNEPYHLWAAVDPRTDVTSLHTPGEGRFFLDAEDVTETARLRYRRLISPKGRRSRLLLEKTPHNVARVGWLDALAAPAAFIHIARDGVDVARSVARVATASTHRISMRGGYNQWWGEAHARWTQLSSEGAHRGYVPEAVRHITTDEERGAYEWLVSMGEARRLREELRSRWLDVTYPDLVDRPGEVLAKIAGHLEIGAPRAWIDTATAMLRPGKDHGREPILLPGQLVESFNAHQRELGFAGVAISR